MFNRLSCLKLIQPDSDSKSNYTLGTIIKKIVPRFQLIPLWRLQSAPGRSFIYFHSKKWQAAAYPTSSVVLLSPPGHFITLIKYSGYLQRSDALRGPLSSWYHPQFDTDMTKCNSSCTKCVVYPLVPPTWLIKEAPLFQCKFHFFTPYQWNHYANLTHPFFWGSVWQCRDYLTSKCFSGSAKRS